MLIQILGLAISSSIDSFGIGITYGVRKTKISLIAKIILFFISFCITMLSICIGSLFLRIFPAYITNLIGTFLLIGMGCFIIYETLIKKGKNDSISPHSFSKVPSIQKTYQFFLKSFGITIQIIRDPISSDLDQSHRIDSKEALYLGFALSIDSLCIGIGSSMLGISTFLFPFIVSSFQLLFLSFGTFLGRKIVSTYSIPDTFWNILSGSLLILIGILRFFF
ncbi:MAG TPA: sporulation membrane protein YtaF [Candidatus Merdicola faecigallinarum]|uniref:Sporulation membrane protein YtaF n=1 Tax=Candidatus Merdicola faecigallinarum TaxID=2840862 RepID=A0A9D1M051_9FIRM|nr:sporulation membrane protein YtaF [Candidatus Merdicola faecigallinarum]